MAAWELSLTEWVVLALVAEAPTHGFAISRELRVDSDLGRILTVHRPLVYRALDRLQEGELVERVTTEPGDAGPNRTVIRATRKGKPGLKRWFVAPVDHVRDLRIEFLVKLRLTERLGRDATALVAAQRAELADTLTRLAKGGDDHDVVDQWRQHNAAAARDFLDSL
jgi:DNA-binding PadR family transcriptional regulator